MIRGLAIRVRPRRGRALISAASQKTNEISVPVAITVAYGPLRSGLPRSSECRQLIFR